MGPRALLNKNPLAACSKTRFLWVILGCRLSWVRTWGSPHVVGLSTPLLLFFFLSVSAKQSWDWALGALRSSKVISILGLCISTCILCKMIWRALVWPLSIIVTRINWLGNEVASEWYWTSDYRVGDQADVCGNCPFLKTHQVLFWDQDQPQWNPSSGDCWTSAPDDLCVFVLFDSTAVATCKRASDVAKLVVHIPISILVYSLIYVIYFMYIIYMVYHISHIWKSDISHNIYVYLYICTCVHCVCVCVCVYISCVICRNWSKDIETDKNAKGTHIFLIIIFFTVFFYYVFSSITFPMLSQKFPIPSPQLPYPPIPTFWPSSSSVLAGTHIFKLSFSPLFNSTFVSCTALASFPNSL
jgi:hypothetical protein